MSTQKVWILLFLLGSLLWTGCTPADVRITLLPPTGGTFISSDDRLRCGAQGDRCQADYPRGARIGLKAQAEPRHYFSGWSGACTGTGDCTLELQNNIQVGGGFVPFQGSFTISTIPRWVVVPVNGVVELGVGLIPEGGLEVPPSAFEVRLESPLVGEALDQVRVQYLPERSSLSQLVLRLQGPNPAHLNQTIQEAARLKVALPGLEKQAEILLVVTICGGGCQ
jgi:hypothetical protein